MRQLISKLTTIATTGLLIFTVFANAQTTQNLSPEAFAEDVQLLKNVLNTLHPGIYRYQSKAQVEQAFNDLTRQTQHLSTEQAYLMLTKFMASFRCSHSHTNPWNQNQKIKDLTSEKADKLPFAWRFFESSVITADQQQSFRFFVDYTTTLNETIKRGTEILAINGVPVDDLMALLRSHVTADGINLAKLNHQLSWQQGQKYQWFDILLPLLAPPKRKPDHHWQYTLTVVRDSQTIDIPVTGLSAQDREKRLMEKYHFAPKTDDEIWKAKLILGAEDSPPTAYMKLASFATWKMSIDWKAWLDNQFQSFANAKARKLILDIRGNEGGMYEVAEYLYPYLVKEAVTITNFQQKVRYKTVPDALKPHLNTWNPSIYDISSLVGEQAEDFWLLDSKTEQTFKPNGKSNFNQVVVLTDGANSSATFIMSRALQQSGQVTLVGETLGGNLKGQTGGQMFFLTLPNSQISIDVPLIHFFDQNAHESVLQPDVLVKISIEDWMNHHDRILQTAIDM